MELGEADVRPDKGLRWHSVTVQAEIGKQEQQIGHADNAVAIEIATAWTIGRWPHNKWGDDKTEKGKKIEEHERKGGEEFTVQSRSISRTKNPVFASVNARFVDGEK